MHDVFAADHRGQREAAADDLAVGGQIRRDAVVLLRAAVGEPEAGDDLVEDERDPVALGDRAQSRPGIPAAAG
jgi:hypothetical protein